MADWRGGGWEIYLGDTLLGTAYFRSADQPFYICEFKPTPDFEAYRAIFDEYATLVNDATLRTPAIVIDDFYETKIESLNLELRPFGDAGQEDVFVVQIYSDFSEAWLEPL